MSHAIRPGRPADVDVLVDFNLRLAQETEDKQLDADLLRAGVAAALADPQKGRYFVAEAAGDVIGCLMLTREWSDWRNGDLWWIQSVYVRQADRSRGVFRSLYKYAADAAKAAGAVGLRLYVEDDNSVARAAYTKLGMHDAKYRVMEETW